MKVEQVLCMVGGGRDASYAANSRLPEKAILRNRPIVEEAIGEMFKTLLPEKMVVADLGCSSGPNTLLVVSQVIGAIHDRCRQTGEHPPEMQFFLNDLPGNDFNSIFRSLEGFDGKKGRDGILVPHYIAGLPGSFYHRLFPSRTVHLFHSSYSLMWRSRVPRELELGGKMEGGGHLILNEGNIYIGKTSPQLVVKLYQEQFQKDMSTFLKLRFQELAPQGHLVFSLLGRKKTDIFSGEMSCLWGLLADALTSIVLEGTVEKKKMDSFNLPFYAPSMEELKAVIDMVGLFETKCMQTFESNWDPFDDSDDDVVHDNVQSGVNVAMFSIRSVMEPLIMSHFGEAIVDELFSRFATNVAGHLSKEKTKHVVLVVALKKGQLDDN